jgi:ribosomal protection tetracycline resistance protein
MKPLNIGILAHVDAGKTSLTERILFDNGVIKTLGSVDQGNTQTDTMKLERERGITIKSAVVSFTFKNQKINIIDTPGHPDFIAEVERALGVLDAVIFVVSAVEGVQAQTRVLMRTLKKLQIPTIIFINKIDRVGAREIDLIEEIKNQLDLDVVPLNSVSDIGTRQATILPIQNINFIQNVRDYPIVFGSAITGVGVSDLMNVLEKYFKPKEDSDSELSGIIFKIERGASSEKISYIKLYSGELHLQTNIEIHRTSEEETNSFNSKITKLQTFQDGKNIDVKTAKAGDIVKIWGLTEAHVNDWIGLQPKLNTTHFGKPNLEIVIRSKNLNDSSKLFTALSDMSEQDPLINIHQTEDGILSVQLYGEVQKEIIKEILNEEYKIEVEFDKTQTIYVEKVVGIGTSYANKTHEDNYFDATLRFKITPNLDNIGIIFKPGPGIGGLPTAFIRAVEKTVYKTLKQGLYGWEIIDAIIEVTEVGYWDASSSGWDFRNITPLLLMQAIQKAGTEVYEPLNKFQLDLPDSSLPKVLNVLATSEAQITNVEINHIEGIIPVRNTFDFERKIPELTSGEGVFSIEFGGYQKVHGEIPTRKRTDFNPLDKQEYMRHVLRGE